MNAHLNSSAVFVVSDLENSQQEEKNEQECLHWLSLFITTTIHPQVYKSSCSVLNNKLQHTAKTQTEHTRKKQVKLKV